MYEMRSRSLRTERLGTGTLTPLDLIVIIEDYIENKTVLYPFYMVSIVGMYKM
jgi:hypothetical protein